MHDIIFHHATDEELNFQCHSEKRSAFFSCLSKNVIYCSAIYVESMHLISKHRQEEERKAFYPCLSDYVKIMALQFFWTL